MAAASAHLDASLRAHAADVFECGTVAPRTKALCGAMIGALNFCTPSLVAHRARARACGAGVETLNALWEYARSDRFSPAEKAALSAAVALTREPRALPDAVWNELRAQYDDAQLVELLCAIGLCNYLDRVSNALQAEKAR